MCPIRIPTDPLQALRDAHRRERRAADLYRALAEREGDERRRGILVRLAEAEEGHARRFAERLEALGAAPDPGAGASAADLAIARALGPKAMLRRMEAEEERNMEAFGGVASGLASDPETAALFVEVEREEETHSWLLTQMTEPLGPRARLDAILRGEKWHVSTGSWIGDAIYGVNDGLGAVFGIVSGMAGATGSSHTAVATAGLLGTLASALSMGSSAFLAARAEREVHEAEIAREKREIEESPEHEEEELALLYQLKGLDEQRARDVARTVASQPDVFLHTMAHEELGLSERTLPSPGLSLVSATASTAIGGLVPVAPFLFLSGVQALIVSAVLSTLAHFVVGVGKSLVTGRSWWVSGLEMTAVGVAMGVVTYVLGVAFHIG